MAFAQKLEKKAWEADAIKWIGITYAQQGQFSEAKTYFQQNYKLVRELGDEGATGLILGNIGTVYYEMGNYPEAQEYLLKSLKIAEKLHDERTISRALNNLGNVNYNQKNIETALDYYKRSLTLKEKMGLKSSLPYAYNNIGLIHSELGNHSLAVGSFNQSVTLAKDLNDLKSESRAYNNLRAEFTKVGQYVKADKGLAIKTRINDKDELAWAHVYRGKTYLQLGRYQSSQRDCQTGYDIALSTGATNLQKEACGCLSKAFEGFGNIQKALEFNKRYGALKDSLFNTERTQEITRTEMNYQFEKRQLADSINYQKREAEQQLAHQRQLNKQNTKF